MRDGLRQGDDRWRSLILVKHALPILDGSRPAREWLLGPEGEAQAAEMAGRLRPHLPFGLITSPERKAVRTCEIIARELGVPMRQVDGLEEIDRPVLPIMSADEHRRANAGIFTDPGRAVLGRESARDALARFTPALQRELKATADRSLVVITHGTVISLFVGEHNAVDAFDLWERLECGSYVVLAIPSLTLLSLCP